MANSVQLLLLLIVISFFISAASTASPPSLLPLPPLQGQLLYSSILSALGFRELSSATSAANLTTAPITIFAPSDSSLLACPSCSLPLLLREHSVPGLFPFLLLRSLSFGTKLETLATNRCLTITTTTSSTSFFSSSAASNISAVRENQHNTTFVNGVQSSTSAATSAATSAGEKEKKNLVNGVQYASAGENDQKIIANGVEIITSPFAAATADSSSSATADDRNNLVNGVEYAAVAGENDRKIFVNGVEVPPTSATTTGDFSSSATAEAAGDDDGEDDEKIFVNGVEITQPDMFNNGLVVIHGIEGYVTHLSPLSCNADMMTSLSFPPPTSPSASGSSITRLMLRDAIIRLRSSGYTFVSLALRVKYAQLEELKSMTIFALDDSAILAGEGMAYLSHFKFHVVKERRISGAELVALPVGASMETVEDGQRLFVTTSGGGGRLNPMKINYVKVSSIDLLHNSRIVVHGISIPFPHMIEGDGGFGIVDEKARCDLRFEGFACDDGDDEDLHGL